VTKWQWSSLAVILTCLLVMGAWDIVAIGCSGRKSSISYLVTMGTYHCPLIPLLIGLLAGHLFWPQTSYPEDVILEKRTEITMDTQGNVLSTKTYYIENR